MMAALCRPRGGKFRGKFSETVTGPPASEAPGGGGPRDRARAPRRWRSFFGFLSEGSTMIVLMEDSRRGRGIIGWLWSLVRFPALLVLVILEPVVAFACSTLALLGVLTTLFFALLHVPHFPAGTMLALS